MEILEGLTESLINKLNDTRKLSTGGESVLTLCSMLSLVLLWKGRMDIRLQRRSFLPLLFSIPLTYFLFSTLCFPLVHGNDFSKEEFYLLKPPEKPLAMRSHHSSSKVSASHVASIVKSQSLVFQSPWPAVTSRTDDMSQLFFSWVAKGFAQAQPVRGS